MPVLDCRTLSISIQKSWTEVAAYLADPAHFNAWASGLGGSLHEADGRWQGQGPAGPIVLRFSPPNTFGIADHWVELTPGVEVYVPLRTVANADGAEVSLTLFRQADMSEADWARDIAWVEQDLATLKRLLEH